MSTRVTAPSKPKAGMTVVQVPTKSVKPYEKNPRKNDHAVDAVARSIEQYGFRQPIVVDRDRVIIVGHTRWKAAQKLGMDTVPVHVASDLSPEKVRALRIADNKTNEIADWDSEMLNAEVRGMLADPSYANFELGFDQTAIESILYPTGRPSDHDPDEVEDSDVKPTTIPGDIWELGDHRLICGDSLKTDVSKKLFGKRKADMCFTDPPWNVAIGIDSFPWHRQRKAGLVNDSMSDADFGKFIQGFAGIIREFCSGDLYCVLGASEWPRLDANLRGIGFHWSTTIIWVKDSFVFGRSKYHRRYEPIWYGWHKDNKSSYRGALNNDDVWEVTRPRVSEAHPTMKPVALVEIAIGNSSKAGGIVFDPFMGSGTTIIAAERLGRIAYGVEIDPVHVESTVRRWEKYTGNKAKRTRS